ncbi:MAG: hypothetical protein MHM6MM_002820 [Cercozoa sp. M6MM]
MLDVLEDDELFDESESVDEEEHESREALEMPVAPTLPRGGRRERRCSFPPTKEDEYEMSILMLQRQLAQAAELGSQLCREYTALQERVTVNEHSVKTELEHSRRRFHDLALFLLEEFSVDVDFEAMRDDDSGEHTVAQLRASMAKQRRRHEQRLAEACAELRNDAADARAQADAASTRAAEAQEQLLAQQQRANDLNARLEEALRAHASAQFQMRQLTRDKEDYAQRCEHLERSLKSAMSASARHEKALAAARRQAASLTSELHEQRARHLETLEKRVIEEAAAPSLASVTPSSSAVSLSTEDVSHAGQTVSSFPIEEVEELRAQTSALVEAQTRAHESTTSDFRRLQKEVLSLSDMLSQVQTVVLEQQAREQQREQERREQEQRALQQRLEAERAAEEQRLADEKRRREAEESKKRSSMDDMLSRMQSGLTRVAEQRMKSSRRMSSASSAHTQSSHPASTDDALAAIVQAPDELDASPRLTALSAATHASASSADTSEAGALDVNAAAAVFARHRSRSRTSAGASVRVPVGKQRRVTATGASRAVRRTKPKPKPAKKPKDGNAGIMSYFW